MWRVARTFDPSVDTESGLAGAREGHLAELFDAAGLDDAVDSVVSAEVEYASFEEWWEPYTLGVGPAGSYLSSLDPARREALRDGCRDLLGDPPFRVAGHAWAVAATVA